MAAGVMQLSIETVPATDLVAGDRVTIDFGLYGPTDCTVFQVTPRTDAPTPMVELGVRIGPRGPGYYTSVPADRIYTVIR